MDCEILIVGAGITGLSIANELLDRGRGSITIIEKESDTGMHASGRNSGVLHSGIYYTPDSLKAKFCVEGNRLLTEYCEKNNLTLLKKGKVIVATDESKLESLDVLVERAKRNEVKFGIVDEKGLAEFEPYAYTYKRAIYSPNTSVFNPKEILKSLQKKLSASGKVKFLFKTIFTGQNEGSEIYTNNGKLKYKILINASGAYADRVAHSFDIAKNYKILPFLGTYSKLENSCLHFVNGNVYPVPDLRNPFLGVHFTKAADGNIYIGPTAIPALGRENYSFFKGLSLETFPILYRNMVLLFKSEAFRDNAKEEIKKYIGSYVFSEAKKLVPALKAGNIISSNKLGIRSQLVDWRKKELVMDFLVIKDGSTVHILNAISPAFTSSMSFAKYIVDEYVA